MSTKIGLVIIALLLFLTIFAPLIANNKPFLIYSTYKPFYQHYFEGWKKVAITYRKGFLNSDEYLKSKELYQKLFDYEKDNIILLYRIYDFLSTCYYSLQKDIGELNNVMLSEKGKKINSYSKKIFYPKVSLIEILKTSLEHYERINSEYNSRIETIRKDISQTQDNNILKELNNMITNITSIQKINNSSFKVILNEIANSPLSIVAGMDNNNKTDIIAILGEILEKDDCKNAEITNIISKIYETVKEKFNNLENNILTNKEILEVLENIRNSIGGFQTKIKRIIEIRKKVQQDEYKINIIKDSYYLDYKGKEEFIISNLAKMKRYASEKTIETISQQLERFKTFFEGYSNKDSIDKKSFERDFNIIFDTTKKKLDIDKNHNLIAYKTIYPLFSSLSFVEILVMVLFIIIVFATLINHISLKKKLSVILIFSFAVSLLVSVVLSSIIVNHPVIDYKKLLKENIVKCIDDKGKCDDYAVFPLIPYGYDEIHVDENLQPPNFIGGIASQGRHVLGTDEQGRDVFARIVWGSRVSMGVGFSSVLIYVLIGIVLGAVAGYFGGWIDIFVSRFIEIVICFPSLFLIMAIITMIGQSVYFIILIIGLTHWTGIARLVRGEYLRIKKLDYIVSAKLSGTNTLRIMFRHILPNALTPIIITATFGFAFAVLLEAYLSFLGIGVEEPIPSWGKMISFVQNNINEKWWLFFIPGTLLFLSVTAINLIGNSYRDASDPKYSESRK